MRNYLFIALLFCFQHVFAQEPPEKYNQIWKNVNTMEPGSSSVQKELKKLRKENPSDPWIFWISGINCNPVTGQEEAALFYRQAIVADSTFPHAYYNLASTIEDTSEIGSKERIYLYTKAISLVPTNAHAYIGRGEAYFELGEYDKALADCELMRKYQEYDIHEADALQLEILLKQNKKQEAFELINKVNFNEGMWSTQFNLILAHLYEEIGDQKNACFSYRNAAEPFEMMGEEIPMEIKNGLKKCN